MIPNFKILVQTKGSSTLSPAHGKGGARATILFLSATPPEKSAGGFQQAGKKEGGLGEGIFARLLSAPKARQGWEAARSCVSRKTKPAKIDSLKEKIFCARPLKEKDIFVDFVRREAASRWGGFLPVRAEIVAQKRFALRSVIATRLIDRLYMFFFANCKCYGTIFVLVLCQVYSSFALFYFNDNRFVVFTSRNKNPNAGRIFGFFNSRKRFGYQGFRNRVPERLFCLFLQSIVGFFTLHHMPLFYHIKYLYHRFIVLC